MCLSLCTAASYHMTGGYPISPHCLLLTGLPPDFLSQSQDTFISLGSLRAHHSSETRYGHMSSDFAVTTRKELPYIQSSVTQATSDTQVSEEMITDVLARDSLRLQRDLCEQGKEVSAAHYSVSITGGHHKTDNDRY